MREIEGRFVQDQETLRTKEQHLATLQEKIDEQDAQLEVQLVSRACKELGSAFKKRAIDKQPKERGRIGKRSSSDLEERTRSRGFC